MVKIPPVGTRVRVELDNWDLPWYARSPFRRPTIGPTRVYVGTIVESDRLDPPGTFCMTTGEPHFPVRCVEISKSLLSVQALDDSKHNRKGTVLSTSIREQTVRVKSSKGNSFYVVTYKGGKFSCPCKGFGFRGMCHHVDEAAKKLGVKR